MCDRKIKYVSDLKHRSDCCVKYELKITFQPFTGSMGLLSVLHSVISEIFQVAGVQPGAS